MTRVSGGGWEAGHVRVPWESRVSAAPSVACAALSALASHTPWQLTPLRSHPTAPRPLIRPKAAITRPHASLTHAPA